MLAAAVKSRCRSDKRTYGQFLKLFFSVFAAGLLFLFNPVCASAEDEVWRARAWNSIDSETAELLAEIGITEAGEEDFLSLSPEKVLASIFGIFQLSFSDMLADCLSVIVILLVTALFSSAAGQGKTAEAAANTGLLACVFVIVAVNAEIFTDCRAAIELTKDMMLSLIPVLAGITAFSGNPASAASFNTVVFAFAQTVSVTFSNVLPAVSVIGSSLGAASAVAPFNRYGGLCKVLSKAVNMGAAFVSGIFVAVLSVRGVIAGAADTVTVKGLRFLIGNAVPVVGSAVGDALNSVTAGLGLLKNSLLALGVAAVALISLPPLIKLAVWSFLLYLVSVLAEMLSVPRINELVTAVKSVCSVLAAVTVFNAFVYIISCAILMTVKK